MNQPVADAGTVRGSLVCVGIGISGVHQTTPEAVAHMRRADRLFYLTLDPITEVWLHSINGAATSLQDLYAPGKPRRHTYREMTGRITRAALSGEEVCVAFYGHPGVLVHATREAVRAVRRSGRPARVVPGISAEDCLYADLDVDPGVNGVQSFEATDFLLYRRRIDPTSELILWQIGVLGEMTTRDPVLPCRADRIAVLVQRLRRFYPRNHRVVLYEASTVPGNLPRVQRVTLSTLPRVAIRPLTTLYVPALPPRTPDRRITRWLVTRNAAQHS